MKWGTDSVEIGCPTSFAKNTIESRYFGLVQDSLNKVVGKNCDLTFIVKTNPNKQKLSEAQVSPLFSEEKKGNEYFGVITKSPNKTKLHF